MCNNTLMSTETGSVGMLSILRIRPASRQNEAREKKIEMESSVLCMHGGCSFVEVRCQLLLLCSR